MGMALYEERIMDARVGMMLNNSMHEYLIPTILDAPAQLVALDAQTLDQSNSINVKGLGEPPLVGAGAEVLFMMKDVIEGPMESSPEILINLGKVQELVGAGGVSGGFATTAPCQHACWQSLSAAALLVFPPPGHCVSEKRRQYVPGR
jgi:hypothetical protein